MPTYSYVYTNGQTVDQQFEAMCQVNALGKDLFGTYYIRGAGDNTITDFVGALNFVQANRSMVGTADVPGVYLYRYMNSLLIDGQTRLTTTPVKVVIKN